MKLTTVLLIISLFKIQANTYSQNTKISLDLKDVTVEELFREMETLSEFRFLYNRNKIDVNRSISINVREKPISDILKSLFSGTDTYFKVRKKQIILKKGRSELPSVSIDNEEQDIITITGTVSEADTNLPLPGVNIIVKGTKSGTLTDFDGNYSIKANSTDVLVFSFMGFSKKEVPVEGLSVIDVSLEEDTAALDEIVVVAYGTSTKKSFTGSAQVVDSEDIARVPVTSVEKALVGNVSGVTVAETSGQPGSYSEIRIRGMGSFSASNSPLYVIDGVVMLTGQMNEGGNLMSTIASGDIESMTVLKDAAATSLYGSRAANGVILITTKQGRKGVTKYSFKTSLGVSDMAVDNYKAASGDDFVMLMKESLENYYGVGAPKVESTMLVNEWYKPEGGYTDWNDLLFRRGMSNNHELSATGGSEKTQFFVSGSFLDQQGIALNSDFKRYSGRINLTHKLNDKFTFGVNLLNAKTTQNVANNGSSYNNPFYNVSRNTWPTESPYDEDGEYKYELLNAGYYNLLREYELMENKSQTFRSLGTGYLEFKPYDFLTLRSTNSYDFVDNNYNTYYSPSSRNGEPLGYVYKRNEKRNRTSTSNLITFDKDFNDFHHFNVIGAFEAERNSMDYFSASGEGLPNESLKDLSVIAVPTGVSGYSSANTLISYLSRLNYDFDNKYYFSSSFRRDGSSRLGLNERWANFWSVSGAWRLTRENFMKDVNFVDDLKFRASYGTSGTLPNGYYDHLALYSYTGSYDEAGAAVEDQISNSDLTWEKNKSFNIGFEFGIFERVTGSFEYFQRHTSDLLMNLDLAPTIGAGSTMVNIGEMENKGYEFEIRTDNVISKNFNWSSSFLFTSVQNKIIKLANNDDIIDGRYIYREGLPYYSFYMPIWAGVDPADGTPMWFVIDDEGNITDDVTHDSKKAKSAVAGSAEPDFYGSFGNYLTYKGFDLSFVFNFSVGGKIWYNSGYKSWNDGRSPKYVVQEAQVNRWQKPGDIADHPQRIWNGNNGSDIRSSRFLFDNDFIRLKDITLSYNIPTEVLKKLKLSNSSIYVQARNLLTFSSQDIVDPEHGGASGYTYFEMPPVKTITVGVEIGF